MALMFPSLGIFTVRKCSKSSELCILRDFLTLMHSLKSIISALIVEVNAVKTKIDEDR